MKWCKHPVVEQNLRNLGIKFNIETGIPFAKVDVAEGKRRQVRHNVDPTIALGYGLKMLEDNSVWNMTILQKERSRYWPWSGIQRLTGFNEAKPADTIDAYTVEIHDPFMMDLLPRVVNTWEAVVGQSKDEAIQNARYMVENHRMPVADAARLFSLKPEQVYKSQRIEESKRKLEKMAVTTDSFSPTIIDHLGRIDNANAMKRAGALLEKYKIKGNEAVQIINDVRQGKTEAEMTVTLEKWESIQELRKKPKKAKASVGIKLPHKELNRERLFKLVTGLARFCEMNKTVTQAQLTDPAHLQIVRSQWKIIAPVMDQLLKG